MWLVQTILLGCARHSRKTDTVYMYVSLAPRSFSESDESASELELADSMEESGGENYFVTDDKSRSSASEGEENLDQSDEDISSGQSESEFSDVDDEEQSASPTESTAEGDDITVMSLASLREDLEKGKAAKEQVCKLLKISKSTCQYITAQ